jgi:uncharacterized membrane protein
MDPVQQVALGWLVFGGSHTLLSHPPLRERLVVRLGERAFQGVYSLVAFATFVPLVWIFFTQRVAAPVPLALLLHAPGPAWATIPLMFVALNMIVLGFASPNPVSSLTAKAGVGAIGPLRITRHPGFMGVALFGVAHLLVNPAPIDRAFLGGLVGYAVLGCAHQDWRKRRAGRGDPESERFFAETSFLPFVAILQGRNRLVGRELRPGLLVAAAGAFVAIFLVHHRMVA